LRPYEVVIILDAGLEEEQITAVLDRSVAAVRDGGGTPGTLDRWGKRRFAYELKHRWEGYYALLECTAEPAVMVALDRQLRLTDGVLRHKVIRVPDHIAGRERRKPTVAEAADADAARAEA
jgi:small subunit ribosomal protein S6